MAKRSSLVSLGLIIKNVFMRAASFFPLSTRQTKSIINQWFNVMLDYIGGSIAHKNVTGRNTLLRMEKELNLTAPNIPEQENIMNKSEEIKTLKLSA